MTDKIEQNTLVSVHYTGTFTDGEVFDSSEGRDPLTFLVGHGQMITGFEQEMLGAEVGEKREFTLTPDRAYGVRTDEAIQEVPRDQFPEGMAIEVGMVLGAQSEQGPVQFSVASVDDEVVTVDFNHQMAGMTLNFSVEVVDITEAPAQKEADSCGPGCGCN